MSEPTPQPPASGGLLVYICGSGHSGSTLLDMLLGGHPKITAIGEAYRAFVCANKTTQVHQCTCGKSILTCPMWQRVSSQLQEMMGVCDPEILKKLRTTHESSLDRNDDGFHMDVVKGRPYTINNLVLLLGSRFIWRIASRCIGSVNDQRHMLENSVTLFEAVRRACATPVVVDSSKNAGRMKGLHFCVREKIRVIHLVRDGRGVTLSRMRREDVSMPSAARIWAKEQLRFRWALATIPRSQVMRCKYEHLCTEPEKVLKQIYDWLGLSFAPESLEFRGERHNIGGNPMRFRHHESSITLDEKWRDELSAADLATFHNVASKANYQLGYDS